MKLQHYIFLMITAVSCAKVDLYEKTVHIPRQSWTYDYKPSFNFLITDTSASYNVFVTLRHTDAYKYNNLWLTLGSQAPGDTLVSQNINLQLANDSKGWEGFGMDDIYEVRKNITPGPVSFRKAGTYQFSVSQIMRENPLRNVLDIGIRVEKVFK